MLVASCSPLSHTYGLSARRNARECPTDRVCVAKVRCGVVRGVIAVNIAAQNVYSLFVSE